MASFMGLADTSGGAKHGPVGPFQDPVSGKLYVFYRGSTDSGLVTVNWTPDSGDPSAAAWSAITANAPGAAGNDGIQGFHGAQDGRLINVVFSVATATNGLRDFYFAQFDMSAGTNGAWVDLGSADYEVALATGVDVGDQGVAVPPGSCSVTAERGNGDIVAVYHGESHRDMGKDYPNLVGRISSDGGQTWGAAFAVTTATGSVGFHGGYAVLTANDRTHIFFADLNRDIFVSTLRASDTSVSTASPDNFEIDTGANGYDQNTHSLQLGYPVSFDDGGTERVRLPHVNANQYGAVLAFDDADTPAGFTDTAVGDNTIHAENARPLVNLANDGTDEYLVYVDAATQDIYSDKNNAADTQEATATATFLSLGIYERSGTKLGIFYAAGTSSWDFVEIGLGVGAPVLAPQGLAGGLAFGAPALTAGAVALAPSGLPGGIAFGSAAVAAAATALSATGLAVTAAFGGAALLPGAVALSAGGLGSAVDFGAASLQPGAVSLTAGGEASAAAFGAPALGAGLAPAGLAGAAAFGTGKLSLKLDALGLPSGIDVGLPAVAGAAVVLQPTGLASAALFGTLALAPEGVSIQPGGLSPQLQFGAGEVAFGQPHGLAPPWRRAASGAAGGIPAVPAAGRAATLIAEARQAAVAAEGRAAQAAAEARSAAPAAEWRQAAAASESRITATRSS